MILDFSSICSIEFMNARLYVYFLADVDECGFVNDCKVNSRCVNIQGGYNCECKEGYTGDGKSNCSGKEAYNLTYILN